MAQSSPVAISKASTWALRQAPIFTEESGHVDSIMAVYYQENGQSD